MITSRNHVVALLAFAISAVLLVPSSALAAPVFQDFWGAGSSARPFTFSLPTGLAVDGLDHVFVADQNNNQVHVFSGLGDHLRTWGPGTGDARLDIPNCIDVDRYGDVYVGNYGLGGVKVFSGTGAYLRSWDGTGPADGGFGGVVAVSVDDANDVVYVAEGRPVNLVHKFTRSGVFIESFGGDGGSPGEFDVPRDIAFDDRGSLFVTDQFNDRVQVFDQDLEYVRQMQSDSCIGVALNNRYFVTPLSHLAYTPVGGDHVWRYTQAGSLVDKFVPTGVAPPAMWNQAYGLDIGGRDIYLVDGGQNRVLRYRDDYPKLVTRFPGISRYHVAVNAAKNTWGGAYDGVHHVVIVCGEDRAMCDALSAAGLTGVLKAPLLLTNAASLTSVTKAALQQMRATNGPLAIHVLGGAGSVTPAAFSQIKSTNPGGTTERIGGADRYVLSAAIARRVATEAAARGKPVKAVLVFNAEREAAFYDALAASAVSARQWMPMVAVRKASVPPSPKAVLASTFSGKPRWVVSASGWVTSGVYSQVGAAGRLASSTNRATAASQIAASARSKGWLLYENVGLANKLPDSLSCGAFMGGRDGIVLYSDAASLPSTTRAFTEGIKRGSMRGFIFGGTASISNGAATSFLTALNKE